MTSTPTLTGQYEGVSVQSESPSVSPEGGQRAAVVGPLQHLREHGRLLEPLPDHRAEVPDGLRGRADIHQTTLSQVTTVLRFRIINDGTAKSATE